jgi:hypothetical protein
MKLHLTNKQLGILVGMAWAYILFCVAPLLIYAVITSNKLVALPTPYPPPTLANVQLITETDLFSPTPENTITCTATEIKYLTLTSSPSNTILPTTTFTLTPSLTYTLTITDTSTPTITFTPLPTLTPLHLYPTSAPRRSCCKYCTTGKPCGNSCISRNKTCHKPPGCAC